MPTETQSQRATDTTVGYGTVRNDKTGGQRALGLGTERLSATQTVNSVIQSWVTFSTNPSTGNNGTCYGDSGGPHLYDASNVLVAKTVTGDRWCRSTDKDYRLDTADAHSFIAPFLASRTLGPRVRIGGPSSRSPAPPTSARRP